MDTSLQIEPLFTEFDYAVVRLALTKLSKRQRLIVRRRFWDSCALEEIADELRTSYRVVEREIESAFRNLRVLCMATPQFSRSKEVMGTMAHACAA